MATEPLALPEGFEWDVLDINNEEQANELYCLLRDHYVEDSDNTFRFEYSIPFLRWALLPPGYKPDWHLAVRATAGKKLLGFISGIPVSVIVKD